MLKVVDKFESLSQAAEMRLWNVSIEVHMIAHDAATGETLLLLLTAMCTTSITIETRSLSNLQF